MATFTALVKFYSTEYFCNTKVARLGEIFVQRKFCRIQYLYALYRQMKLLLNHYGIKTTEFPETHEGHSGLPPPSRRASEGLGVRHGVETPPSSSAVSPRHSWPSIGGVETGASRTQVGRVMTGLSQGQLGFEVALNPLVCCCWLTIVMIDLKVVGKIHIHAL